MKQITLVFAALLLAVNVFSQKTYTLKEAINYSLDNHGSTAIYNNDVKKVGLQTKEAIAGYLPQVSANVTLDDNLKRQTSVLPGAIFGSDKDMPVQFGNKYNTGAVVQLDQTIYDQSMIYGIKAGVPAKKVAELNLAKNKEDLMYNTASA